MHNVKLIIAYDGTKFCGWQIQKNNKHLPSVQELVQKAVSEFLCEEIKLVGAGRTDSGAHALCQAAAFRTDSKIPTKGIAAGVNNLLPFEIRILNAVNIDSKFHPQYSAKGKAYRYLIHPSSVAHPHLMNRAWQVWGDMDVTRMKRGARHLLGKHDFSSFKAAGSKVKSSVRKINEIKILNIVDTVTSENLISITVEGDGFLRHMVRNIVGLLVDVGLKKFEPSYVKTILEKKRREPSHRCAPSCGLYLVSVKY